MKIHQQQRRIFLNSNRRKRRRNDPLQSFYIVAICILVTGGSILFLTYPSSLPPPPSTRIIVGVDDHSSSSFENANKTQKTDTADNKNESFHDSHGDHHQHLHQHHSNKHNSNAIIASSSHEESRSKITTQQSQHQNHHEKERKDAKIPQLIVQQMIPAPLLQNSNLVGSPATVTATDAASSKINHMHENPPSITITNTTTVGSDGDGVDNVDGDASNNTFPLKYFGTSILHTTAYQPKGKMRYQEWKDGQTPYQITQSIIQQSDTIANQRKIHIQNSIKHAWKGYKTYAFGYDEITPKTGKTNKHWGGIGTTLIDALDTLWLAGMKQEFWEARDWVRDKLNHDVDVDASVFETTIRSLGGLLGAYTWSQDEAFLNKAKDIGDRLHKAFQCDHGIPYELINLKTGRGSVASWLKDTYIISEMGTLQLEFRELARITGDDKYAKSAERVFELLKEIEPKDGLYPYFLSISGSKLKFSTKDVSFGAFGDSFYEYELKIWLQGGRKEPMYREMYDRSMDGMHSQLLHQSQSGLWFIGKRMKKSNFDHLTCFMGGLLALGAYTDPQGLDSARAQRDLQTAKRLAYTCYQMYAQMPTGLAADVVDFAGRFRGSTDFTVLNRDYALRPETVETFYILNKLTNDPIYREWGWEIYQSIEKYCKTEYAYGKHPNVKNVGVSPDDSMESFFMGETMKYLYLLNDPTSEVDILNKHVFNTEAHPLTIFE